MKKVINSAADVQGLAATIESTETGTMSNVQVNNNSKESTAYQEDLDIVIEDNNLNNEEGCGLCPLKELTWIAEDYPEYFESDDDTYIAEYDIAGDICAKLGENYTCFWTEGNMYFWDSTKWEFDSAELNFKER